MLKFVMRIQRLSAWVRGGLIHGPEEPHRNALNVVHGHIALSTLHGADIGSVQSAKVGEHLLGEACVCAQAPHMGRQWIHRSAYLFRRREVDPT